MDDEVERVMTNPDNVIMSDGLSEVLNAATVYEQNLVLNDVTFMCNMRSAKLLSLEYREWEFELEVVGLDFTVIAAIPEVFFNYGERTFANMRAVEIIRREPDNFLILALREIVITEEDLSDE